MPPGYIQIWEREHFLKHMDASPYLWIDDEAHDMHGGIPIVQCIKRSDGIHISADDGDIHYELHFDPQAPDSGNYAISRGPRSGTGRVVEVRQAQTPSIQHYFYVKVVSQRAHHFVWRVAFDAFTAVADGV